MNYGKCLIFLGLLFAGGCKDTVEQIPGYIQVQPFVVHAPGGANWQKITDCWIYVNGEFLGAYTLPALVPALADGETEVIIYPGVKENGIKATPNIYPFLQRFEKTITVVPGETTSVTPETQYDDLTITAANATDDFDDNSIPFVDKDSDTGSFVVFDTDNAYAGRSARLAVDTLHPLNYIATDLIEGIPTQVRQQVWLELHYRNDVPFDLWLVGESSTVGEQSESVFLFNIMPEWNKIYINLTNYIPDLYPSDKFRILLRAALPTDDKNNYTQPTGEVQLDNIRLVHF